MNLQEIVEQLMACHFTCEAGDLEHNIAFDVLRQWAGMGASVIANPCEEHTDFVGSLCPVCMYAQLEALRGVNQTLADRLAGLEAFADTHRGGPVDNDVEVTYGDTGGTYADMSGQYFDPSTANKVLVMPPAPDVCRWEHTFDAPGGIFGRYDTGCGHQTRIGLWYKFCPFCGRKIEVEE